MGWLVWAAVSATTFSTTWVDDQGVERKTVDGLWLGAGDRVVQVVWDDATRCAVGCVQDGGVVTPIPYPGFERGAYAAGQPDGPDRRLRLHGAPVASPDGALWLSVVTEESRFMGCDLINRSVWAFDATTSAFAKLSDEGTQYCGLPAAPVTVVTGRTLAPAALGPFQP